MTILEYSEPWHIYKNSSTLYNPRKFTTLAFQKWFYPRLGSSQEAEYTLHMFKYVEISSDSQLNHW